MLLFPRPAGGRFVRRLHTPLVCLSKRDRLTLEQVFRNILVVGSSGAGKTTGSGDFLRSTLLATGGGFLVMCAKADEASAWIKAAKAAGRGGDVIVVRGDGSKRLNLLQYQMQTSPDPGGLVMNVVDFLTTIIETANGRIEAGGGGENQFFVKTMREAFNHAFAVLYAAYGKIDLYDLSALIQSRPHTYQQAGDPAWQDASFMAQTLIRAEEKPAHPMHPMDYRAAFHYLTHTLANPDARTTGNIIATISAELAPLMQGTMRELFCTGTNFVPEMTHHGAILILDLPLQQWGKAGLLAQSAIKYIWQRATEARTVNANTRPVFLWADEAHLFVSPYDASFLSTCRGSRCGSVFLTQNYPGLLSKIGGSNPQNTADALLGNFSTKIFHANGCSKTNQWASETIGRGVTYRYNGGANQSWSKSKGSTWSAGGSNDGKGGYNHNYSHGGSNSVSLSGGESYGYSEQMDFLVQPRTFTELRTGGKSNGGRVDAVLFQTGRVFHHSGRTFLPITFRQR